ncbi:antisense paternally expressed gene 3 [Rattus norvegicus]|uniref:Antisense paternally expressed gene 3 n=2 Tax=Rattus norvegicus TaxID=10116 RepID=A0A8I5ZY71_RAT|nr:antisense paternally expressed gene 3 [Rattus norvegicus]BAC21183.1 hypothetical protein [Rattus norvegicus]
MKGCHLLPYLQCKSLSCGSQPFIRHYCDLAMVVTHSLKAKTLRFTGKSFRFHEFTIKRTMSWLENKNPTLKNTSNVTIFCMKTTVRYINVGMG